ncbi:hypothetical protein A0256_22435 [Mucilaginibacter sp. PAMC 26640]|nr:hypothetical protein A0256_22435 [Mucilaginibacter sp. PAMC 26640]
MLLGSTSNNDTSPGTELLVLQLILQQRYAEVYQLLNKQQSPQASTLYNMALCLHWSGNYQGALNRLENIRLAQQVNGISQLNTNSDYQEIRNRQNQTDDYLHGMSEAYIQSFPVLVSDAILRLKTDCWLQLGNYAKVIAVATPIAHKGYKNITEALKLAETSK